MPDHRRKIILRNSRGVRLIGRVEKQYEVGGSQLIQIALDGTTSTIEVDLADFQEVE